MSLGKSIALYLMDGDAEGRWSATLSNWNGQVYKIPREALGECDNMRDLQAPGVYFLFGRCVGSSRFFVYIGEADNVIKRILQPHAFETADIKWTDSVIFVTPDNTLDKGKVKYLENRFYMLAKEAAGYQLQNANTPPQSPLARQTKDMLEEFIIKAKLMMPVLGYNVFEKNTADIHKALTDEHDSSQSSYRIDDVLYCSRRNGAGGMAIGKYKSADEFVVFKGSYINPVISESVSKGYKKDRKKYKDLIGTDNKLLADITFSAASRASVFVVGTASDGKKEWKNQAGVTLKTLLEIHAD